MSTVSLKDAKAGLSSYVDDAIKGEFVTITRHGKPVAALVPLEAAEIAHRALKPRRSSFVSYLKTFPGGEFERNVSPSRDVDLLTAYLLDTNVISLLSPSRAAATDLIAWLEKAEETSVFFLSAVTVHEIERGIVLLEQKGATAKAGGLRRWMDGLFATYEDCILPIDAAVSALSGKLEADAIAAGHSPGMADALIAGTAQAHDLTVVTLNLRHFEPFGINLMPAPV